MTDMVTELPTVAPERNVSLRDLALPLFRRKTLLLTTFLVVFVGVGLTGVLLPPPFKSQMAILVDQKRLDPLVTTEATNQAPPNNASEVTLEEINSEAELLLSQDLLEKVVLSTGLDKISSVSDWLLPARTPAAKVERAVKKLAKKIKIKNETNSNLITVSYMSADPRLSWSVMNSLGNLFVEKNATVHRPPGSFQFFDDETERYRLALLQSEDKLRQFSRAQHAASPDLEQTDLALQVAGSVGQVFAAQQAVASDKLRIQSDEDQMKTTPARLATQQAQSPADKLLEDLGSSLLTAETKRAQLALKYEPSFPSVKEADQEIEQTTAAIAAAEKTSYLSQTTDVDPTYELLREDLAKTRADLAAQRATESAARDSVQSIRSEMVNLDDKAITMKDLLRDAKGE